MHGNGSTKLSSAIVKIEFYVPESHLETVKQAMFDAGAGRLGDYDCCAWQTPGQGQYRPLSGSNPYLGVEGEVEQVAEYKVEMIAQRDVADKVVSAMKEAHPYEEVAYCVMRIES